MSSRSHFINTALVFMVCCLVATGATSEEKRQLCLADLLSQDMSEVKGCDRFRFLDIALHKESMLTWYRDGRPYSRMIQREYMALRRELSIGTEVYERTTSTNELIRWITFKPNIVGKLIDKRITLVLPFAISEIETPEGLEAAWGRADFYELDHDGTGTVVYEPNRPCGAVFRYEHKRIVEITLQGYNRIHGSR